MAMDKVKEGLSGGVGGGGSFAWLDVVNGALPKCANENELSFHFLSTVRKCDNMTQSVFLSDWQHCAYFLILPLILLGEPHIILLSLSLPTV